MAADPARPIPAAVTAVEPSAAAQPAPISVAEPPSVAAPSDVAPVAAGEPPAPRGFQWLTALLAGGVLTLLAAPLAFVRRRKQQPAAPAAVKVPTSIARRPVDPVAGIDVVEGPLAPAPAKLRADATPSPKLAQPETDSAAGVPDDLRDLAATIGPTDAVDLDVGAPVVMNERVAWFADRVDTAKADEPPVGDEALEENAATARMPNVDPAVFVERQAPRPKAGKPVQPADDEQMTLTIVELDLLRQDYEAEYTLTQQASQALDDAVADLKATQAARAATAETATLESPQIADADDTGDTANLPAARVRMK
jgi:hypothetical protein